MICAEWTRQRRSSNDDSRRNQGNEQFPVGETFRGSNRDTPLSITESGTPDTYRVYDGRGTTIDVSDWGRLNPERGFAFNMDSAIFSRSDTLKRLVVQRCKLHHPAFDGSTWYEPTHPTHTRGAQCISLFNTAGNHVIRYNECYSDLTHMYNDDFDYDLYNGRVPQDQEAQGIRGEPVYAAGAGFDSATRAGRFQLAPTSPGADAGQPLPNFSTEYTGSAPDIGAHQRGAPSMRYGVNAQPR